MSDLVSDDEVIRQWVQSAWSDLLYAEMEPPAGVMYEQPCFHAQQAAEKAIKALLQVYEEEPPYIHDLRALIALLQTKTAVPEGVTEADTLTRYAVLTRYPSLAQPATEDDWRAAVALARAVVEWVEQQMASPPTQQ